VGTKKTEMAKSPNLSSAMGDTGGFSCSHALRLSAREWVAVLVCLLALIVLAPAVWDRAEGKLSNDYWHYRRHCRRACDSERTPVIGDSVIWGHYVAPDQTLSHYLNELAGRERFANLGLDGTHPAALEGLLKYYADGISRRAVLLHFNPLWMTSKKHDLQTTKEFHFNHPRLVPQFRPQIPCYRATFSTRLWAVTERYVPFFSWTSHLRCAYWENMGLHTWTLEHPAANPLTPLRAGLPAPLPAGEPVPPQRPDAEARKQNPAWVEPESSLSSWSGLSTSTRSASKASPGTPGSRAKSRRGSRLTKSPISSPRRCRLRTMWMPVTPSPRATPCWRNNCRKKPRSSRGPGATPETRTQDGKINTKASPHGRT